MNLLRNPLVTGALAVVAVVVVIYQLLPVFRGRGGASHAHASAPALAVAAAAEPAHTPRSSGLLPAGPSKTTARVATSGIEREYVALHFAGWVEGARRDPFLLHQPLNPQKGSTNASSVSKWKLRAIWRQTDSRVAAINRGIYKEGDVLEGYKIIRIEDEAVWFQNADSLDHLEFHGSAPVAPTSAKAGNAPLLQPEKEERP